MDFLVTFNALVRIRIELGVDNRPYIVLMGRNILESPENEAETL